MGERKLFSAWCRWLCYPNDRNAETEAERNFLVVMKEVEHALDEGTGCGAGKLEGQMTRKTEEGHNTSISNDGSWAGDRESYGNDITGPFFLGNFSTADVVFIPYVERMAASLYYYKGLNLRAPDQFPALCRWFDGLERRSTYRGTRSDFHTHVHDLPPQMGGCYSNDSRGAQDAARLVDAGPWNHVPDGSSLYQKRDGEDDPRWEALARCLRHYPCILAVNPGGTKRFSGPLRYALTLLVRGCAKGVGGRGNVARSRTVKLCSHVEGRGSGMNDGGVSSIEGSAPFLRYLRDRINVPRDMSLEAARYLRQALESAAQAASGTGGSLSYARTVAANIPLRHRRDQNPMDFH